MTKKGLGNLVKSDDTLHCYIKLMGAVRNLRFEEFSLQCDKANASSCFSMRSSFGA